MLTTTNILSAYIYLLKAEQMPDPVLLDDGSLDTEADNTVLREWSERSENLDLDQNALQRFIDRTETLLRELETFEPDVDQEIRPQYMSLFYEAAKDVFDGDKKMIRTYFEWLYLVIFCRPEGPRWGEFVTVYGQQEFVNMTRRRFSNLI